MNVTTKLSLGLVIIIVTLVIIFVPKVLKVGDIACESQFGPCSQILVERLDMLEGKPIGDSRKQISEILTSEVLVKDFSVQILLPNRLQVNLLERKSKFALKVQSSDSLALADEEGYIVGIESQSNLPQLVVDSAPGNVGEKVSDENLFAMQIVGDLFSFYQVREGKVSEGNLQVELKGKIRVIFPLEGDRSVLISSLELVLKRYDDAGDVPREIDLRYKNPVIRE